MKFTLAIDAGILGKSRVNFLFPWAKLTRRQLTDNSLRAGQNQRRVKQVTRIFALDNQTNRINRRVGCARVLLAEIGTRLL